MNIIIIDDSEYKMENICEYMKAIYPDAEIWKACCTREGLVLIARELRNEINENPEEFLIVTDMVMPFYKDEEWDRNAGYDILMECKRLRFKCPIIIASSEEVDDERMKKEYPFYIGSVKEDASVWCLPLYQELLQKQ